MKITTSAALGVWAMITACDALAQSMAGPPSAPSPAASPGGPADRGLVTQPGPPPSGAPPPSDGYGALKVNGQPITGKAAPDPPAEAKAYQTMSAAQESFSVNQGVSSNELASRAYGLLLRADPLAPTLNAPVSHDPNMLALVDRINATGNTRDSEMAYYLAARDGAALDAAGHPLAASMMAPDFNAVTGYASDHHLPLTNLPQTYAQMSAYFKAQYDQAEQAYSAAWSAYEAQTGVGRAAVLARLEKDFPPGFIDVKAADPLLEMKGAPGVLSMPSYPGVDGTPAAVAAILQTTLAAAGFANAAQPAAANPADTTAPPSAEPPPSGSRGISVGQGNGPEPSPPVDDSGSATTSGWFTKPSLVEYPSDAPLTMDQLRSLSAAYATETSKELEALQAVLSETQALESEQGGAAKLEPIYANYIFKPGQNGSSVIEVASTQLQFPSSVMIAPSNQVLTPSQVMGPGTLSGGPSPALCGR